MEASDLPNGDPAQAGTQAQQQRCILRVLSEYPESLKRQTHAVMAALVAAMTSGSLPLLMAGAMAGHDEIIRLTLL
jgi:TRAP-type mannitol/chloroaromatic compound transport system substrate-binding protein